MRYLSVCSGIEAATQAWAPLGWQPVAFSEIEPFPCAVLAHHYPAVPNWGDMTRFEEWPDAAVDVLCGGTPCQSFSVAGLRKGLDDPRGSLMLTFGAIAARYRPRWLVWENVPGVLSSSGGRDFGAFLGMLGELGYGWSYRVLDAQHVRTRRFPRAVPQRRRRVFVVGYLGDWRRAAAVLFDRESLSGHPAPRRRAGEVVAGNPALGFGGGKQSGPSDVAACLVAKGQKLDWEVETFVAEPVAFDTTQITSAANYSNPKPGDACHPLSSTAHPPAVAFSCKDHGADASEGVAPTMRAMTHGASHANGGGQLAVAHALRGEGFDASEDGTGRGTPIIPVPAVAFDLRGREGGAMPEGPHDTANLRAASGGSSRSYVAEPWAVRRLTLRECERLQGFPDDFTRIPWGSRRRVEAHELLYIRMTNPSLSMEEARRLAADGPRYKALGNSWAVNCAEWIGERIAEVDAWVERAA